MGSQDLGELWTQLKNRDEHSSRVTLRATVRQEHFHVLVAVDQGRAVALATPLRAHPDQLAAA